MEKDDALDLSTGTAWRGLDSGMTHETILAHLKKAGVPTSELGDDGLWVLAEGDWDMEFRFSDDRSHALRQVVWSADDLRWNNAPITNVPLHEALQSMRASAAEAAWSPDDASEDPMDGSGTAKQSEVSDEELLAAGTLWLPERGLGLIMCEGEVIQVVWRRKEDLPTLDGGPLTPAQLNLSKQPDLASLLTKRWKSSASVSASSTKWTPLQWLLTLAMLGGLGFVAKQGFAEMMLWQKADVIAGHLVRIEPRPVKQGGDAFHVIYRDPQSREREIVLQHADFYVPPREPGDEVQLNYVDGDPPRVKGLPRARDAAFIAYFPWGVGIAAAYSVAMVLAGWLPRLLTKMNPATAPVAGKRAPFPGASKQSPSRSPGRPPGGPDVQSF